MAAGPFSVRLANGSWKSVFLTFQKKLFPGLSEDTLLLLAEDKGGPFEALYDRRSELKKWIDEYSPMSHVTPDDPPIFLEYPAQKVPRNPEW